MISVTGGASAAGTAAGATVAVSAPRTAVVGRQMGREGRHTRHAEYATLTVSRAFPDCARFS